MMRVDTVSDAARSPRACCRTWTACLALLSLLWAMFACFTAARAEPFDDWRDGDLVFENRPGSREASLWSALRQGYTHAGIVRLTGGGPYVLDITSSASELPLADFVARSVDGRFSVYRVKDIAFRAAAVAAATAWRYSGYARDPFLNDDRHTVYDAKLIDLAYRSIGLRLGRLATVGSLSASHKGVLPIMLAGWRDDPICGGGTISYHKCLNRIESKHIFILQNLSTISKIERVYTGSLRDVSQ